MDDREPTGNPEIYDYDPDYKRDKGIAFKPKCVTCENMVDNNGVAACNTGGCQENRK